MHPECEATVQRIMEWGKDIKQNAEEMPLREWADKAASTSPGAAYLERKITLTFPVINDSVKHTDYAWRMIADLSGIHPNWPGYRSVSTHDEGKD